MKHTLAIAALAVATACQTAPDTRLASPPRPQTARVELSAVVPDEAPRRGSVIVLATPAAQEPPGARPGPFRVYGHAVAATHGHHLERGDAVEVEVEASDQEVALCAWYDRDGVFMQRFAVAAGSAWSSECPVWRPGAPPPTIRLDRVVEPAEAREAPEGYVEERVSVEGGEVRFLVGLPPGYAEATERRYPTLYAMHGFNGDRYAYLERFAHWREAMEATGQEMILVVLDAQGTRYGHHLFVDSEGNGPMGRALAEEIVPYVDRTYRTRAERDARGIWGQSSGGFTAVAALLDHPEVFGHGFPCSPDPLNLPAWWLPAGGDNVYTQPDGSTAVFFRHGEAALTMREFVEVEAKTGLYGQFTAFLAVFSEHRPGQAPLPFALPFDPRTGAIDPEVWGRWLERDPSRRVAELSQAARGDLDGRLHLTVSAADPFRLTESTVAFSEALTAAGVEHEIELLEGAGHGDYYTARFLRRFWDRAYRVLAGEPRDPMAFWGAQRGGANFFNAVPRVERFEAGAELGLEYVRLVPDKWSSARRDFLIGDADSYEGLVTEDALELRRALDQAHRAGLRVVLGMLSLPGARWVQNNEGVEDARLWRDASYHEQAARFWRDLAREFRDHPAIVAWNPLNEPHPERADGIHDDSERYRRWYEERRGTLADVNVFNRRVVAAIREVDPTTPILLDAPMYAAPGGFRFLEPVEDARTLYAVHLYEPWEFVNKRANKGRFSYPARMPGPDGRARRWTTKDVAALTQPVQAWADEHGVPRSRLVVGEFGCHRQIAGCDRFLRDLLTWIDRQGWHWAFYSFREDTWDGMDYELGQAPLSADHWAAVERGEFPERDWHPTPTIRFIRQMLRR